MAHVAPVYPNFARGEVSPLMFGRIDIEQYPSCLDKCRNTYIRPYGCASRLTGTEFVSQTKNSGKVRLLKFVFSATDSYIIECGAGYFRFYQNGAPVMKNNAVYEISNDYYEDQLDSIQYVQLDDIIKLTCLPHNNDNTTARPKELIRNASDSWTFRNVTFVETPYLDQNTSSITMKADATTGSTTLHASADYFTASMVGANIWLGTKVKDSATNKDVQGYVKITGYTNAQEVTVSVQSALSGTTATKLWGEGAFSDRRGYPSCVALYDGRLYYARTPYQPRNIYGSKPYAYETFTPAVDNEDDAGINIALATNANGDGSDIKWIIGASYLLCGTYGGEFVIRGTGDGAITPTDISARQRTNWGGEPVQPIVAGTFVHFLQRNGNKLRQFQYDYYYDAYKAVDVSIFSEHLLESPIKAMALQKNPDSIIYLMREDGNVVMLTLEQDQSVQAWSLLEEMGAKVESIQTIPSFDGNYDEVYMVMNRYVLDTTLTYACSNPNVDVDNTYTGLRADEAGTEIINLTYDGTNGVWVSDESTEYNTKLLVTSSNPNLTATSTVSSPKSEVGTETDTLTYTQKTGTLSWNNVQSFGNGTLSNVSCICSNGNGYFVAISRKGILFTSNDGQNWTNHGKPSNLGLADTGTIGWFDVTYGNGKFVAISGEGYISTSTNGTTWTTKVQLPFNTDTNQWRRITYGSNLNKFVAVSIYGYTARSTNPTTSISSWNVSSEKAFGASTLNAVSGLAYKNGTYYAFTSSKKASSSSDGISWSALASNSSLDRLDGSLYYVNCVNGKWIFVTSEKVYSGDSWVGATEITNLNNNYEWYNVTFYNTRYILMENKQNSSHFCTCDTGEWKSQETGQVVNIANFNDSKIVLSGAIPSLNNTLACSWVTIQGYEPLPDGFTISGMEDGDTLDLIYTTAYTSPVRYIERMMNPITPDNPNEWWYVRSGLKYDGYALTEGVGLSLTANGGTVTATASSSIFTSSMEGNRIRLKDDNYNTLGEGTITEVLSNTQVTLEITTYFQSLAMTGGTWGISTDTLSGLDHLETRTVQVYADCKEQANKVVTEGSINIDDAFIAVVGLPYTSYITTMPMEAGSQNGTAVGKRKRISEMAIRVWNSLGVKVGRDLDHLYDTIYEQEEAFTGVIPNIKYNQGWVWDANITVEQSHPYPMNILSIAPLVTEVDK